MHPLAGRQLTKMNGLGNVIGILDLRGASCTPDAPMVRAIGRAAGLGFDQLMVLHDPRSPGTEAFMRIYNSDGSEAGACGNGTRCVAWHLLRGTKREALMLETAAGPLACWRRGEWRFAVDMGRPRFAWQEIPLRDPVPDTSAIAFTLAPADAAALGRHGQYGQSACRHSSSKISMPSISRRSAPSSNIIRYFRNAPIFPSRRSSPPIISWSKSGSAARASPAPAARPPAPCSSPRSRKDLCERKATVSLPGGDLAIAWRDGDDHVVMAGPVEFEFETVLDAALFEDAAA